MRSIYPPNLLEDGNHIDGISHQSKTGRPRDLIWSFYHLLLKEEECRKDAISNIRSCICKFCQTECKPTAYALKFHAAGCNAFSRSGSQYAKKWIYKRNLLRTNQRKWSRRLKSGKLDLGAARHAPQIVINMHRAASPQNPSPSPSPFDISRSPAPNPPSNPPVIQPANAQQVAVAAPQSSALNGGEPRIQHIFYEQLPFFDKEENNLPNLSPDPIENDNGSIASMRTIDIVQQQVALETAIADLTLTLMVDRQLPYNLFSTPEMTDLIKKIIEYYEASKDTEVEHCLPSPARIPLLRRDRKKMLMDKVDEVISESGWIQILLDEKRQSSIQRIMFMCCTSIGITFILSIERVLDGTARGLMVLAAKVVDPKVDAGILMPAITADSCNTMVSLRELFMNRYDCKGLGGGSHLFANVARQIDESTEQIIVSVLSKCDALSIWIFGHNHNRIRSILQIPDNGRIGRSHSQNTLEWTKKGNLILWVIENRIDIMKILTVADIFDFCDRALVLYWTNPINWARAHFVLTLYLPCRISCLLLQKADSTLGDLLYAYEVCQKNYSYGDVLQNAVILNKHLIQRQPPQNEDLKTIPGIILFGGGFAIIDNQPPIIFSPYQTRKKNENQVDWINEIYYREMERRVDEIDEQKAAEPRVDEIDEQKDIQMESREVADVKTSDERRPRELVPTVDFNLIEKLDDIQHHYIAVSFIPYTEPLPPSAICIGLECALCPWSEEMSQDDECQDITQMNGHYLIFVEPGCYWALDAVVYERISDVTRNYLQYYFEKHCADEILWVARAVDVKYKRERVEWGQVTTFMQKYFSDAGVQRVIDLLTKMRMAYGLFGYSAIWKQGRTTKHSLVGWNSLWNNADPILRSLARIAVMVLCLKPGIFPVESAWRQYRACTSHQRQRKGPLSIDEEIIIRHNEASLKVYAQRL